MFSSVSNDVKHEPSSETPWCDLIYDAAKKQDKAKIQEILKYATIDVRHQTTDDTAVSKLAADGNVTAVNFLRKEFNASLIWVIFGYGRFGTESDEIKKILSLDMPPSQMAQMRQYLIYGYARGRHVDEVNALLLSAVPEEKNRLLYFIAYGYSQGGYDAWKKHIDFDKLTPDTFEVLIHAGTGVAQVRNDNEVKKILDVKVTSEHKHVLKQRILMGYARGRWVDNVTRILDSALIPNEKLELKMSVVYGYAQSGHLIEALNVLESSQTSAIEKQKLLLKVAAGYARGGHRFDIEKIRGLASTPKYKLQVLGALIYYYSYGKHTNEVYYILSLTNSISEKTFLVQDAINACYDTGNIIFANILLCLASELKLELDYKRAMSLNKTAFLNERNALETLSAFNPDQQKPIATEMKVDNLLPKSTKYE